MRLGLPKAALIAHIEYSLEETCPNVIKLHTVSSIYSFLFLIFWNKFLCFWKRKN